MKKIKIFGERLKIRLKAINKNQTDLAAALQVSNEAVSKWARGDGNPTFDNLMHAAQFLKCTIGYLVGDIEDRYISEVVMWMQELDQEGRRALHAGTKVARATFLESHSNNTKSGNHKASG
jgi:transcriptional regulator with XRE-family HTH domain